MPELPEVEVICRGLRPHLLNRIIHSVRYSGLALRLPVPLSNMQQHLNKSTIIDIQRRAKYVQIFLDNDWLLVIHLGMTGNLGIFDSKATWVKHDHLEWQLDNNIVLRYNDIRRFGSIQLLNSKQADVREETIFKTCGPEPLGDLFSATYLYKQTRKRVKPVKNLLMDSKVIVGVGNIYANESLFLAGISPRRRASSLTRQECKRLSASIKEVLQQAISCGGSTISDFRSASQERGYFQINFKVYGRNTQPCTKCQSTIEKITVGGRASYYCPNCQN